MTYLRGTPFSKESPDRRALRRAAGQWGALSLVQAEEDGLTQRMVRKRVETGVLIRRAPGVFVFAGAPHGWEQDLIVACLHAGPGSAASHRSAARLFRLPGWNLDTIEITAPRRVVSPIAIVHTGNLPANQIRRVKGIPVTDPTRLLCDIGAVVSPDRVEEALDACLIRGLTSPNYLLRRLQENGGRGVRGTGAIREILASRDPANMPSESVLETRFRTLLRRRRLPMPEQQRAIYHNGQFVGRVDFIYPSRGVIIEVDSVTWHSSRQAWEEDLERRNQLTLAGWRVLHITWFQMKRAPWGVISKVREALSLEIQLPLQSLI
jgi:very-short-patch-repair endonuclease